MDKIIVSANDLDRVATVVTGHKGGDPEVLLTQNRRIISSTELLSSERQSITEKGCPNGASIFSDGFQAEINFNPQTCKEMVIRSIQTALSEFRKMGVGVSPNQIVRVDPEWLKTSPISVRTSGCKPDFDAYRNGAQNPPVNDFDTLPIRFAGGHISVSQEYTCIRDWEEAVQFIKLMDRIVGVTSVIHANGSQEKLRRKYYGRPGCFRFHKDKYIEYRCMSNWWMRSPILAWIMYGFTDMATAIWRMGLAELYNTAIKDEDVIRVMTSCDKDGAIKIFAKIAPSLCGISERAAYHTMPMKRIVSGAPMSKLVVATLLGFKPSSDVYEEWSVDLIPGRWDNGIDGNRRTPNGINTVERDFIRHVLHGANVDGAITYLMNGPKESRRSVVETMLGNLGLIKEILGE